MLCDSELTRKALEENEDEIREYLNGIISCINEDDLETAKVFLSKAENLAKDAAVIYFYKGVLSFAEGDFESAEDFYKAAIKRGYVTESSLYHLGCILMFLNKPVEALEFFSRAENMAPELSRSIEKKAEIYLALGRYRTLLIDASKLIRMFPEEVSGYHYKFLGMLLQNHIEAASDIISYALVRFPDEDIIKMDLIEYYDYIGDYETALKYLMEYCEMDEKFSTKYEVREAKIKLLYKLERYEEVDIEGTELFKENYTNETALYMLISLIYINNHRKALQCVGIIKQSIVNPEESDDYLYYCLAIYYEALIYKKIGNEGKAEELFHEAAEVYRKMCLNHTSDMELYIFRCLVLYETGEYEEAIKSADFIETMCGSNLPEIYYIKSLIYQKTGDKENQDKYISLFKETGKKPGKQFIL